MASGRHGRDQYFRSDQPRKPHPNYHLDCRTTPGISGVDLKFCPSQQQRVRPATDTFPWRGPLLSFLFIDIKYAAEGHRTEDL